MNHAFYRLTFVFATLSILVLSCNDSKVPKWSGQIKQIDGTLLIKNPRKPIYPKAVLSQFEELTIGYSEENKEAMFTNINDIAVDSDENIYLLDTKQGLISVFNKNGIFQRTIGKRGQGPGEFQYPTQILISPQQELVVCDLIARRLLFFHLDGTFKKSISTWPQGRLTRILIDSKGNIIGEVLLSGEKRGYSLKKYDPNFKEIFSIAAKERLKLPLLEELSSRIVWTVSENDDILWGDSDNYEINVLDHNGTLLRRIQRDHSPEHIIEADYRDKISGKFGGRPIPLDFDQALPNFYPAFRSIAIDNQGRLLVNTFDKSINGTGNYLDVFDSEAKYIAKIPLSTESRKWAKGKLYTTINDENGFPALKRYGIRWQWD
ncbi:MAG: 6-bladed beta-propeller [Thermoplasmata archaeon]|nr:6-bladed beta-propeller [Thermoplasmata archaeon]